MYRWFMSGIDDGNEGGCAKSSLPENSGKEGGADGKGAKEFAGAIGALVGIAGTCGMLGTTTEEAVFRKASIACDCIP